MNIVGSSVGTALAIGVKKALIGAAAGTATGVGLVFAIPAVVSAMGFTAGGIAAGTLAAKMMSATAIANGGGVAAGSTVAVLQSVGAAGLSRLVPKLGCLCWGHLVQLFPGSSSDKAKRSQRGRCRGGCCAAGTPSAWAWQWCRDSPRLLPVPPSAPATWPGWREVCEKPCLTPAVRGDKWQPGQACGTCATLCPEQG
ncbi:uncharacterized protein LOC127393154 isoform X5 [Apus apus]|nr:uncharacterized protein LOC127393154 isoform X5 [Apus apus]